MTPRPDADSRPPALRRTGLAIAALVLGLNSAAFAGEVETSESWFAWSEKHAQRLLDQKRRSEAVEELAICAFLRPGDLDVVARAAIEIIEAGSTSPETFDKKSRYYVFAQHFIRLAVSRGGGPAADGTPGDRRVAFAIGRLYFADQDWMRAYQMFREAYQGVVDHGPAPGLSEDEALSWLVKAVVNRAPLLIEGEMYQPAYEDLRLVIEKCPDHPQIMAAHINLAIVHRRRQEHPEAERILRKVVERYPEAHQAWNAFGQVLQDEGNHEEALEAYRRAVRFAKRDGAPFEDPLIMSADVLIKLDRREEAEAAIEEFSRSESDSPDALYLLAKIRREEGRLTEAVKLLRRGHRLAPGSRSIPTLLSQVLYDRDAPGDREKSDKVRRDLEAYLKRWKEEMDAKLAGREPGVGDHVFMKTGEGGDANPPEEKPDDGADAER